MEMKGMKMGREIKMKMEVKLTQSREEKEVTLMVKTRQVNCESSCRLSCCCQIESVQQTKRKKIKNLVTNIFI